MASITMWRRGERRCVLVVADRQFHLRLIESDTIVLHEQAKSADLAVLLAGIWEQTHAPAARIDPLC
jgi:hypothetical protein